MICPTCDGKGHVGGCQSCETAIARGKKPGGTSWPVSRCWRKDLREWFNYCNDCEEHFRFWGRIGDPEG